MRPVVTHSACALSHAALLDKYLFTRNKSVALAKPLSEADAQLQSMPDASPSKWHLAHTSWFFESFILKKEKQYRPFHPDHEYLFNSYYHGVGKQFARTKRGMLSRPNLKEIISYREYTDDHIKTVLTENPKQNILDLVFLGLQHEQQHQELMLTDIKHALFQNPMWPAYQKDGTSVTAHAATEMIWHAYQEGVYRIGRDQGTGFCFDNESPEHAVYIHPFRLASRPVSNAEFLHFLEDDAYNTPLLWLSDGWAYIQANHQKAPLYWEKKEGVWFEFTLHGLKTLNLDAPVCHLSFYEAQAYANWLGKRLPTEAEWEIASQNQAITGNFQDDGFYQPQAPPPRNNTIQQLFGDVWEWTCSPYTPYPGFTAWPGNVGEYNGKFMSNQYVLRGGSCVTPEDHIRPSYRNFFYPHQAWQFSGMRLAEDLN